jgi:hypothetical protein
MDEQGHPVSNRKARAHFHYELIALFARGAKRAGWSPREVRLTVRKVFGACWRKVFMAKKAIPESKAD